MTVFDHFDGHIGTLNNFAGCLKSPDTLLDAWMKAVIRQKAPLHWKEVQKKYLDVLLGIKSSDQVLLVANEHLI